MTANLLGIIKIKLFDMKRLIALLTISLLVISFFLIEEHSISCGANVGLILGISFNSPYNITYNTNSITLNFTVGAVFDDYNQTQISRFASYSLDGQPSIPTVLQPIQWYGEALPHTEYSGIASISQLSEGKHNIQVSAEYDFEGQKYNANSIIFFSVNTTVISPTNAPSTVISPTAVASTNNSPQTPSNQTFSQNIILLIALIIIMIIAVSTLALLYKRRPSIRNQHVSNVFYEGSFRSRKFD